MSIICLTSCDSVIQANFIKNNLENEGIECFLTNEISSTLLPGYINMMNAGVKIMLHDVDFEKASKLINLQNTEKPATCPNCNSSNIKFGLGKRKVWKVFALIFSLLVAIPFGNIKRNYFCIDCQTEF